MKRPDHRNRLFLKQDWPGRNFLNYTAEAQTPNAQPWIIQLRLQGSPCSEAAGRSMCVPLRPHSGAPSGRPRPDERDRFLRRFGSGLTCSLPLLEERVKSKLKCLKNKLQRPVLKMFRLGPNLLFAFT